MKNRLKKFKGLFWFLNINKLDFSKDKNLIIHQVLAYGTFDDFKTLKKIYGLKTIRKEFLKPKKGLYYPSILNFYQYLLGIKKINKNQYLKQAYGPLS